VVYIDTQCFIASVGCTPMIAGIAQAGT